MRTWAAAHLPALDPNDEARSLVVVDVQALRAEVHCDRIVISNKPIVAVARLLRRVAYRMAKQAGILACTTGILALWQAYTVRISDR